MRFLCICEGGNVRSVALAQLIKEEGHEAIAIGMKYHLYNSLNFLSTWADSVIDVRFFLPKDEWHNPRHPELKKKVKKIWEDIKKEQDIDGK